MRSALEAASHDIDGHDVPMTLSAGVAVIDDPEDPIELLQWKELFDLIEDATNRIELVAKVVGSTVMRNA